ncbi:acyl-CoA thioester hydrolase YciA [Amaricoccus sp. W119]|uniref:acyl-CoA thioester hydrolase YciA n=1 Tax=Amaricoccus sp. W119 TaxID=3391833 RepID=UPI0039A6D8A0
MQDKPKGTLALQTIAMPADTNANGDIFGGWLMSQMDLGGAVLAWERARGRVATVAVEAMTFLGPVRVGDIVSFYATMAREGTTSMTIEIEAWVRRHPMETLTKVTDARFIYVAIDDSGRKRPLSPVE